MAKKLKTPRRKSVTKPVRRYDTSGRTIGSGATTRRTTRTPKVTGVTSLQPKRKVGRPSQGKTEVVTSKSGKTYRRPVRAAKPTVTRRAKPKVKVTPRTVYVAGGAGPKKVPVDPSEVTVKRGRTAVPETYTGKKVSPRAVPGGYGDKRTAVQKSGMGYGESAYSKMRGNLKSQVLGGGITTGGPVKQATKAEIKAMQRQMDRERNMNRVEAQTKADMDAFDKRFRALKRKLSGIQGNPGLRGIFMGGGGSGKR